MRRTIFIALVFSIATPATTEAAGVNIRSSACAVAQAYAGQLVTQIQHGIVFMTQGLNAYHHINGKGWYSESDDLVSPPPHALLTAANRKGAADAVSKCSGILDAVKAHAKGRAVTVSGSNILVEGVGEEKQRQVKISISLPVMSPTAKESIFFSSQESGPTAGGGYAYYMKRSKHGWVILSSKGLWVA